MRSIQKKLVLNAQNIKFELFGWSIYVGLSLYSALNIASIRYGSPDDVSLASMQFGKTGILENSIESAKQTGRIQQIPFFIFNSIGLRETPAFLTQTIKFISAFLIFILFTLLVKKIYGQSTSLISSIILISTIVTSGEYNSINSFPLWFSFGIITFLISCLSYLSYLENKKIFMMVLTVTLFGISLLASEIYFVLILIFPLLQIKIEGLGFRPKNFINFRIFYFSLGMFTIIYLFAYQLFRIQSKGSYEGTELTFANPFKSLLSTLLLSIGQFNIYGLKRIVIENNFKFNLLLFIIFTSLFIFLYLSLNSFHKKSIKINGKELFTVFILGLGCNILLGFTVKYSKIGLMYPLYLHSLISYLFICLLAAILCIKLANRKIVSFFLSVSISVVGYLSFLDQSREYKILRNNQLVFAAVDCLGTNKLFTKNVESQVISEVIQVASKSYTYNYFGSKLGNLLDKEIQFYRDMTFVDKKSPYTVINLSLNDGVAVGTFQTIRNNSIFSGRFQTTNSTCEVN